MNLGQLAIHLEDLAKKVRNLEEAERQCHLETPATYHITSPNKIGLQYNPEVGFRLWGSVEGVGSTGEGIFVDFALTSEIKDVDYKKGEDKHESATTE